MSLQKVCDCCKKVLEPKDTIPIKICVTIVEGKSTVVELNITNHIVDQSNKQYDFCLGCIKNAVDGAYNIAQGINTR